MERTAHNVMWNAAQTAEEELCDGQKARAKTEGKTRTKGLERLFWKASPSEGRAHGKG